jgi:CBS domain-containing protein
MFKEESVFTAETTAFLEGGCALVIGSVGADGEPTASRAWGLTVLSRDGGECRLLLDAAAEKFVGILTETDVIAVTAADVPTLRSVQLKGVVTAIETATDADRDRAAQYTRAFFDDIANTDGTELTILEHMRPHGFLACLTRFDEIYDQTPGPAAGAAIGHVAE